MNQLSERLDPTLNDIPELDIQTQTKTIITLQEEIKNEPVLDENLLNLKNTVETKLSTLDTIQKETKNIQQKLIVVNETMNLKKDEKNQKKIELMESTGKFEIMKKEYESILPLITQVKEEISRICKEGQDVELKIKNLQEASEKKQKQLESLKFEENFKENALKEEELRLSSLKELHNENNIKLEELKANKIKEFSTFQKEKENIENFGNLKLQEKQQHENHLTQLKTQYESLLSRGKDLFTEIQLQQEQLHLLEPQKEEKLNILQVQPRIEAYHKEYEQKLKDSIHLDALINQTTLEKNKQIEQNQKLLEEYHKVQTSPQNHELAAIMEAATTQKQQLTYKYSTMLKQIEKTEIVQKYKEKQKELQIQNLQDIERFSNAKIELDKKLELVKKQKSYDEKELQLMKLRESISELSNKLQEFDKDQKFDDIKNKCTKYEVSYRENQVSIIMTELSNKLFDHLLQFTTFINQCLISEVLQTSYRYFYPITDELYLFYLLRYDPKKIQEINYYVISSIVQEKIEIPQNYTEITSKLVNLLKVDKQQRRQTFQDLKMTNFGPLYSLLLTTDNMDTYFETLCRENEIPPNIYNMIKKNVFEFLDKEVSDRLKNYTNFI